MTRNLSLVISLKVLNLQATRMERLQHSNFSERDLLRRSQVS